MAKQQIKGDNQKQILNDNIQANVKSSHRKTTIQLESGKSAITMNGGKVYPLLFKEVLAGEYIKEWKIDNLTRIITPLVPTMDKIKLVVQAYFVPNTRVLENWEEIIADKDDISSTSGGYPLPNVNIKSENTKWWNWKNTLAARYGIPNAITKDTTINILPIRGYRAIENDYLRNKQYEPAKTEWNTQSVSTSEIEAINAFKTIESMTPKNNDAYIITAAQTTKNYYTNILKNPYKEWGEEDVNPIMIEEHLDWQTKFQDQKQKAENANKNDWEIIAEMGGTSPVRTDRVEYLGSIEYDLNYQQITQSSNDANAPTPLGTTGSFSYTRANGTLFSHKEFKQHGYIHILGSVILEKAPENGIPKELLKITNNDIYRPGLAKKEIQLMYAGEISGEAENPTKAVAYQPAWAEYKRLPNLVSGEMRTKTLKGSATNSIPDGITNSHWHNLQPQGNLDTTITGRWFRDTQKVNEILMRNNVINHPTPTFEETYDDLIMNMSEHKVKVSLPIEKEDIKQIRKAEVAR